jgi:hypothetical protein
MTLGAFGDFLRIDGVFFGTGGTTFILGETDEGLGRTRALLEWRDVCIWKEFGTGGT